MKNVAKHKAPWCKFTRLPLEAQLNVYRYCVPHAQESCINTNLQKAMAQHLGREIRKPMTQNGFFSWSEQIDGEWRRFKAPLSLEYAKKIDHYDRTGVKFSPPTPYPYGPTEEITLYARTDSLGQRAEAQRNYTKRVRSGEITPREKQRRPQMPIVARRQQKNAAQVGAKRAA